jgi:hypothetical protein
VGAGKISRWGGIMDMRIPFAERLKYIPGLLGIQLNEAPKFVVVKRDHDIELREYEPMLLAKTRVREVGEDGKNQAFEKLARFIFGQNVSGETLHMTSPVLLEESPTSTAMSFVLSKKLSGKTAPMPLDSSIHIVEVPIETWAVLEFSGRNTSSEIKNQRNQLESWLILKQYPRDPNSFRTADYDATATIPFLRRNEVQFRIYRSSL